MAGLGNQIKTLVLLAVLTGLLLFVGAFFGKVGLFIALIFSIAMNFGTYWFSDKIVLWMYGAKEINPNEHKEIRELVKDVCNKANLPMPKLYIIDSNQPNAFATGRNEKHSAIAFTKGILTLLDKEELKGVIAHELSHVKNKDILVTTIAATIAGVITYLARMAQFGVLFGGGRDNENGGNIISLLILVILTPIIAILIQLAISRSREYLADESGARILKNPDGLARALAKLEKGVKMNPLKKGSPATGSLFILNPFSGRGFFTLLSTHPPIEDRIARLKKMKF